MGNILKRIGVDYSEIKNSDWSSCHSSSTSFMHYEKASHISIICAV